MIMDEFDWQSKKKNLKVLARLRESRDVYENFYKDEIADGVDWGVAVLVMLCTKGWLEHVIKITGNGLVK